MCYIEHKPKNKKQGRPGNEAKSRGLRKVPRLMNTAKNLHRKKFYKAANMNSQQHLASVTKTLRNSLQQLLNFIYGMMHSF